MIRLLPLLALASLSMALPRTPAIAQAGWTGILTSPANRYCLRQWPTGQVDCRFASAAQCRKAARDRRDSCVVNSWETTGSHSLNRN